MSFVRTRQSDELSLREASSLINFSLYSQDGEEVGQVLDVLFDDKEWVVRYIEVDLTPLGLEKKVLIPPDSIEIPDWEVERVLVPMKGEELRSLPSLPLDEPVSRPYLIELYEKSGWIPYWVESKFHDERPGPKKLKAQLGDEEQRGQDPHLFNLGEMSEYRVEATDGDVGYVDELILDEEEFVVYYLVVAIEAEIPEEESSKNVLVAPDWVTDFDRGMITVRVDVDRETLAAAPEYDPSAPITRDYEYQVFDHYGRPHYWIGERDTGPEDHTAYGS
jgi:sporulation protein YlmC with PRC-barrel domain